jgi:hypothetical protein
VADWLSSSLGGVAEKLLFSAVDSLTKGVDVSRHREGRFSEICSPKSDFGCTRVPGIVVALDHLGGATTRFIHRLGRPLIGKLGTDGS